MAGRGMGLSLAGAAGGAAQGLEKLLAARQLEAYRHAQMQMLQAELAQRAQAEANRTGVAQAQVGLQQREFAANEQERGRVATRQQSQDDIAATARRQVENQRGVRSKILEGLLQKTTDPRTAQLMAAGEGVEIPSDVLDPERATRAQTARDERLHQQRLAQIGAERAETRPPAAPGTTDPGMQALAELTARSGQLPEGTPTQSGAIMQHMATNPALLAQYEQTRMAPIRAQAQTMLSAVDDLLTKEGALTPGARALFGEMTPVFARNLSVRPGPVAANASLRQIIGQRVVDLIREMKSQSQTGATGFGQLNRAELDIILASATRLTQRLPEAAAQQELATLREKFSKILQPSGTEQTTRITVAPGAADRRGAGRGFQILSVEE